ncbi:MAG TPA: YfhO family protein, partial [Anaerolineae bacterium]
SRVITDESVFPSLPALRGSLFPNTALIYGWESVQAYSSLAFAGHSAYLTNLSPTMLNLLNARYWMVPLEPRPETKSAAPPGSLALDIVNNETVLSPTMASGIEITTFTERAYNLGNGTGIGVIELRRRDGRIESFPLRLGAETTDWDYARTNPAYRLPAIAHSFPGFWRSFGRNFDGHTYLAHFNFEPGEIIGVSVKAIDPAVRLTVESVRLCNAGDCGISVARVVGQDDFSLAYMSDTVAAWDNLDVLPRAFVVHTAEIVDDDTAFGRLKNQDLRAGQAVLLSSETMPPPRALQESPNSSASVDGATGRDLVQVTKYESQRVELAVTTERAGYLVLADSWYPGWNAWVDGQPTPIARADFLFRAVLLEPGQHTVVFDYQPLSFRLGALVSALCLLAAGFVSIILYRSMVNIQ